MNTATIYFLASFAGIIGMITFKSFELKRGKRLWLSLVAERFDHIVHRAYGNVRTFISYFNRRSAIALVQWIAYHILSLIRSVYLWIREKAHAHPPSKKVIDMVRGKGDVTRNGGASFYLKKISEDGI